MSARLLATPSPRAESFRERLQRELAARCGRNPRYSLRGFANFLGVDHATLSQILRGKRAVTATTIRRLGVRIGLDNAELERYGATERRPVAPARERRLAEDAAAALEWHAYAILELMRLREFRPDVGWIQRVLGVPADDVNIALQHLMRLGFLRMKSRDEWQDLTGGAVLRQEQFTLRALQRLLERSSDLQAASLRNAPSEPRLHGAVTVAVTATELARVLALAEDFLREVSAGASDAGEQLYHLELHCFPISPSTPKG
jgi:transcriptional regulator with XRE-family HTH domain